MNQERNRIRPRVEQLEDREVPVSVVVNAPFTHVAVNVPGARHVHHHHRHHRHGAVSVQVSAPFTNVSVFVPMSGFSFVGVSTPFFSFSF